MCFLASNMPSSSSYLIGQTSVVLAAADFGRLPRGIVRLTPVVCFSGVLGLGVAGMAEP